MHLLLTQLRLFDAWAAILSGAVLVAATASLAVAADASVLAVNADATADAAIWAAVMVLWLCLLLLLLMFSSFLSWDIYWGTDLSHLILSLPSQYINQHHWGLSLACSCLE